MDRHRKDTLFLTGFTLLELIVVIIIVAILAVISLPRFTAMKQTSLNQEAFATLKIIQDAQKYYKMKTGSFYPSTGSQSNESLINANLSLNLPTGITRAWEYAVYDTGCTDAKLYPGAAKTWHMEIEDEVPKNGGC